MKYQIGLIGPGKLLGQAVRKITQVAEDPYTQITGVCVTDGDIPDLEIPVYSRWQDLVRDFNLDFMVLLSDDRELKKDIRENLPLDVDLAEENPGQSGIINIIARSVFQKKFNKKVKFLESLVQALPFAAIIFNKFGIVTHWNNSCEELTKVSSQNIVGKKEVGRAFYYREKLLIGQMLIKGATLSEYQEVFSDPEMEIELNQDSVMIKGFVAFKGTMQGYYQITAQKIILDGKDIGAIELIQDLNPLAFLQEEASRKQAALHSIVKHLPFPIIQTTRDGAVIFANRAGEHLLRHMADEETQDMPGNVFFVCPVIQEEFSSFIRNLSVDGSADYNAERQMNKSVYWKESHLDVTCLNPPGQTHEIVWIIRNISLKEKEAQLNTALAMVGTISHELSQPLTAIINSSQLLARTKPDDRERAARHQKIINEQGERLFGIYKKLQNITQVRLQRYLDTQILDLEESAEDIKGQNKDD